MQEFPKVVYDFCQATQKPVPQMQDLNYLMHSFDQNGDGRISYDEFYKMLMCLAGLGTVPVRRQWH